MPFVDDHRDQVAKALREAGVTEHQLERFRRGNQHLGHLGELLLAQALLGVAGARLDPQVPAHARDRLEQCGFDVPSDGSERRDVQQAQPRLRVAEHRRERAHRRRVGFARAGRHLQQPALAAQKARPDLELKGERRPAPGGEVRVDWLEARVG